MPLPLANTIALAGVRRGWRPVAGCLYAAGVCPSTVVPWLATLVVALCCVSRRESLKHARKDKFIQPAEETFRLHVSVRNNCVATNFCKFI
jgi:hypothetical protein